MIVGYRDKHTERFAAGGFVKRFQSFEQQAIKRLTILNAAPSLETLGRCRAIGWKPSVAVEKGSIPFASTGDGGSVSSGQAINRGRATSR